MSRHSLGSVAAIDDPDPQPPLNSAQNDCNYMDTHITDEEIKARKDAVERILSQRNMPLIRAGIEAYKRDLPRLLRENRYLQMVAYRGDVQVALAPSPRKLDRILAKKGFTDRNEVFITCITPLGDEAES